MAALWVLGNWIPQTVDPLKGFAEPPDELHKKEVSRVAFSSLAAATSAND